MKVTKRDGFGCPLEAELDMEDFSTIFWALHDARPADKERAEKLRAGLCGTIKMTAHFDGRGKNGL